MKTVIIYASIHHKNTEKIAKAMAEVLNAKLIKFTEVKKEDVLNADLVGFGSGIYFAKFHKSLIDFVENLDGCEGKKAFLFSTAGMRRNVFLNRGIPDFRKIIERKKFKTVGEFECLGFDTYSVLKILGGINKGRPNDNDVQRAKEFAKKILSNYKR